MSDRVKSIFTNLFILTIVVAGIYWVIIISEKEKNSRLQCVAEGYKPSKGIITGWTSYKGHSIALKYSVAGIEYEKSTGWDRNPKKLNVGDSISLIYCASNPNLIITEVENAYHRHFEKQPPVNSGKQSCKLAR